MRHPIRRFKLLRLLLIVMMIAVLTSYTRAIVPLAEPSLPQRLALADLVLVGKVTAMEPDLVNASPLLKISGVGKIPYQVAVVSVQTSILGGDIPRQVRVGYVVLPSATKESQLKYRRLARLKLAEGQKGCFFLTKHPEESFYVAQAAYDFLDESKTKDYAKKLAEIKHDAELLRDPDAGLQSKSPADRLRTAAMLIFRYRTARFVYTGKPTTAPIDASQSRGILAALAEAEWKEEDAPLELSSFALFMRLDLTAEDGWTPPESVSGQIAAAKKWLTENGSKYRIQKYVPEDKGD
ncbi:MAG TPA: hypothetical protein VGX70_21670 [Gemmataceae bacterium]|jgi:hypothetical protein|nr:hypothetical protein [Gemmataceae bacterium]